MVHFTSTTTEMASKSTSWCLFFVVTLSFHFYIYYLLTGPPKVPQIRETWWGKGIKGSDDVRIVPFKIDISKQDIQDLKLRLNLSRHLAPSLETTQHQYGLNPNILHEFLDLLKNGYNITERQEFLNQFPQYTTQIQGLTIHFLHVKPENPQNLTVLPLLLLHGWPSSVREFYEMIPTLTTNFNQSFVFELVIPTLPGFGYSSAPQKPECRHHHVAQVFMSLMRRLKHERFYVHGSDWGAMVANSLAAMYPEAVLGFHSNFCFSLRYVSWIKIILGSLYPSLVVPQEYQYKLYPLLDLLRFYLAESGYLHIQGTKPDTIGATLQNSPEGLFAFILEKLSVGSNKNNIHLPNAGLDKFDRKTLLDIILFYYWFPRSATTSARFYAENLSVKAFAEGVQNVPIDKRVPCGCAFFEHEFIYQPPFILRDIFTNLIHYTTYNSGGHFAALEENDLLMKDIISFVSKTVK